MAEGTEAGTTQIGRLLGSPLLWGGVFTWAFYQAIPHSPVAPELLERYFCGHPLEYVTATMFFVGMTVLGFKALGLWREESTSQETLLSEELPVEGSLARAEFLLEQCAVEQRSGAGRRLGDLCRFVARRGGGRGVEDHARFLADQAAERMQESYSLVRTITWAVPILGFLGTVIGITMAVANVTPEQLDTSLSDVTDGLAVAFDTTALALALSLVQVFVLFFVQRIEQGQLSRVESWSMRQVAPLLAEDSAAGGRWRAAEARAARTLMKESEAAICRQAALWDESLQQLRLRWIETLEQQTREFQASLSQGMQDSLADHDRQLAALRGPWLQACRELTGEVSQQTERLVQALSSGVGQCVSGMNEAAEVTRGQLDQLRLQGELLLKVIEREEELAGLEQRLVENLEAVRTAEAFEQTLHSLSAAVHLLTARAA